MFGFSLPFVPQTREATSKRERDTTDDPVSSREAWAVRIAPTQGPVLMTAHASGALTVCAPGTCQELYTPGSTPQPLRAGAATTHVGGNESSDWLRDGPRVTQQAAGSTDI